MNIFHETLIEEIKFDQNIIESIQNLDINSDIFEKRVKLIAGMFNHISCTKKENVNVNIITFLESKSIFQTKHLDKKKNCFSSRYTINL